MTVRMVPSPPQYAGPQRPARPQYNSQQIRDYVIGNGWADQAGNISNPQAIYGAAQQYGVSADQLDQAGNWQPGFVANYIQQQGWNPLSGVAAPQGPGQYQPSNPATATTGGAPQGYNYTAGPAGSSGGLTSSPGGSQGKPPNPYMPAPTFEASYQQSQQQIGNGTAMAGGVNTTPQTPAQQPTQYGYGTAPGQSNLGYYEQQTPAGSFAASEGPNPYNVYGASNPYMGWMSPAISGQASVLPFAQQLAGYAQRLNPFLGSQTQQVGSAGTNPLIGRNPYLEGSVRDSLNVASENFKDTVLPQFDRMDRASGSFGNTGVQAARERAMDSFGRAQSSAATNAFMQDYTNSQALHEGALNRTQQTNLANAGFNAGDLSRNLGGFFAGQGLGMQGMNSLLGAGQFDATMGNNVNQFNASLFDSGLGRNQNLAQGLSMFNAGAANDYGRLMSQLQQQNNQFNAGSANSMLSQYRGLNEQGRQFDENLNWGIDRDNWNRMRTGSQDEIDMMERLMRMGQTGIGNANYLQGLPLEQLSQFVNLGRTLGGSGGQNVENYSANPYMAAIAAYLASGKLFGG